MTADDIPEHVRAKRAPFVIVIVLAVIAVLFLIIGNPDLARTMSGM